MSATTCDSSTGSGGGGFKVVNSCDVRSGPLSEQGLSCSQTINVPGFCWCADDTPRFLTPSSCPGKDLPSGVSNCNEACAQPMTSELTGAWTAFRTAARSKKLTGYSGHSGTSTRIYLVTAVGVSVVLLLALIIFQSYTSTGPTGAEVLKLSEKLKER